MVKSLYYQSNITQSKVFWPMAAQLSLEATMLLIKQKLCEAMISSL